MDGIQSLLCHRRLDDIKDTLALGATANTEAPHGDFMTWKRFPHYWRLGWESGEIPHPKDE